MKPMTIGRLAKATSVSAETIRYYERSGFLPPPERMASGYRVYSGDSIRRIRFIKQAQALGFTLSEVVDLLDLTADESSDCASVNEKAKKKLVEIDKKIGALEKMRDGLKILAKRCPADEQPLSECTIINHLFEVEA